MKTILALPVSPQHRVSVGDYVVPLYKPTSDTLEEWGWDPSEWLDEMDDVVGKRRRVTDVYPEYDDANRMPNSAFLEGDSTGYWFPVQVLSPA